MEHHKNSPARIAANARYDKKTYDLLRISVRRDSELNGDAIRAHAEFMGESVSGFFTRAVAEAVERDKQKSK